MLEIQPVFLGMNSPGKFCAEADEQQQRSNLYGETSHHDVCADFDLLLFDWQPFSTQGAGKSIRTFEPSAAKLAIAARIGLGHRLSVLQQSR